MLHETRLRELADMNLSYNVCLRFRSILSVSVTIV
jgi:hypothetical protein